MSILQVAISLFFILNALGNLPLFLGMLRKYNGPKQKKIIVRELLIALLILMLFNFFGDEILHVLGISHPIIGISGGILLFLIALGLIFPKGHANKEPPEEPFIIPLAIPIIAGPGALSSVMVYAEQLHSPWTMAIAILLAWVPSALILFWGSSIRSVLGEKGLLACERLGGMLICLLSIKMLTVGLLELFGKAA